VKDMLRNIQTNRANLIHGRLPQVIIDDSPWHKDAVGGRPPHHMESEKGIPIPIPVSAKTL
jgi:hypothetical protein